MSLAASQYGGMKGCGADNFLVQTWEEILIALEDERACACEVKPDQLFTRFDPVNCVLLKPRLYFTNPLLLIH